VRDIDGIFAALRALGTARLLAVLYLAYGLAGSVVLSLALPPLQTPDENRHALRVSHLANGHLLGELFEMPGTDGKMYPVTGGPVDPALVAVMKPFLSLRSQPAQRAKATMWEPRHLWSAERVRMNFITSMYAPMLYLPQVATVHVARAMGASVVDTLTMARIAAGACAVAVGAAAIAMAGGSAVWLFALLTLPMSLAGMGTIGPEGLLLTVSALVAALLWRMLRGQARAGAFTVVVAGLCLVVMTRPAYVALALLPLAVRSMAWRSRLAGMAVVLAAALAWSAVATVTGVPNVGAYLGAAPAAQTALLLSEPWRVLNLVTNTMQANWLGYWYSFIGVLGWLDTLLTPTYYRLAGWLLLVALAATLLRPRAAQASEEEAGWGTAGWIAVTILGMLGGIFGILYLTWSPVGHPIIDGVQGRYFLPIAMLAGVALPGLARGAWVVPIRRALVAAVAIFPAYSLGTAISAVIARYYLT
jgi:uncharacterized membrane protein